MVSRHPLYSSTQTQAMKVETLGRNSSSYPGSAMDPENFDIFVLYAKSVTTVEKIIFEVFGYAEESILRSFE